MKIVFMGNPDFAVLSLEELAASNHDILAVVTNPPKPSGRGRKIIETPVALCATELGLHVLQIDDLHTAKNKLLELKADVFAVVAYRILPKNIIAIPTHGAINLHGSLLPKYRGAAPIQWSLINGEKKTGLTTFFIEPNVDAGQVLLQKSIKINNDDDYGSLSKKMSKAGAELFLETIDQLATGSMECIPQNDTKATKAPKITPKMTMIDWNKSANDIHNLIRGLSPVPGARTFINGKSLKIFKTDFINEHSSKEIGAVINIEKEQFSVQSGSGQLIIKEVQLKGKKRMASCDFLRGINIDSSIVLG